MTRIIDQPQEGMWAMRLARHGAEVGAAILRLQTTSEPGNPDNLMERSSFLQGYIDSREVDWFEVWTRKGREIDAAEYYFLVEDRKWAKTYAPDTPEAQPHKAQDIRKSTPVF